MTSAMQLDLDSLDVSDPAIYRDDSWRPLFARLRAEAPVHFCAHGRDGPFWSITRHADIARVEADAATFSSAHEYGGVALEHRPTQSLIQSDQPDHTAKRLPIMPAVSPRNLALMQDLIRERTARVLDGLPRGETFDWAASVSTELTSMMLATLFGLPIEERAQLFRWSNIISADLDDPDSEVHTEAERHAAITDFFRYMLRLAKARRDTPAGFDIISVIMRSEVYCTASAFELTSLLSVLLVGGNDTTRNSMSGAILGFHRYPDQWAKLRGDRSLIPNAVAEILRHHTPILYQRRTATRDVELGGRTIARGDKLALWYVSANRDEAVFEDAEALRVDRPNARSHLAFGAGPHRCVGAKVAELQLRIYLEELLQRDLKVEVMGAPAWAYNNMAHSVTALPARLVG